MVIWFVFQALTGKDDEKVPSAQSEKIEVQKAKDSPLDTKKDEVKAEEPKKEEPKKEEPKKEEQPDTTNWTARSESSWNNWKGIYFGNS